MISILTALLAASSSDILFHDWCAKVGIETPLACLRTTTESVAGRGVFAKEGINEGDVVIRIPEYIVLHEHNGANSFPEVARRLKKQKSQFKRQNKWWHLLFQRHREESEFSSPSDWWQAELTAYAIASMEEENQSWIPWISQWQRSDPMQDLIENTVSWKDEAAISACVEELHQIMPCVSKYKLSAAVHIRMGRLEELRNIFHLTDAEVAMYGVLVSRAIELGEGLVGVLPMFDMINHSNHPNLALSFDGTHFDLWALRNMEEGEEFFLCYHEGTKGEVWDEDAAVWTLVQWGIPQVKPRLIEIEDEKIRVLQS
jgi:hypothetical protein